MYLSARLQRGERGKLFKRSNLCGRFKRFVNSDISTSATQQPRLTSELTNFPPSHHRDVLKSVPIVEIMRRYVVDWTLAGWLLSESPGGSWYENFFHRNLRQLIEEEAQPFVIFQISTFYHNEKVFLALDGVLRGERGNFVLLSKGIIFHRNEMIIYFIVRLFSFYRRRRVRGGSMKSSLINASSVCAGSVSGCKLDYLSNRVFK